MTAAVLTYQTCEGIMGEPLKAWPKGFDHWTECGICGRPSMGVGTFGDVCGDRLARLHLTVSQVEALATSVLVADGERSMDKTERTALELLQQIEKLAKDVRVAEGRKRPVR